MFFIEKKFQNCQIMFKCSGPDDWMSEPALHSKKPWRAVLARRRLDPYNMVERIRIHHMLTPESGSNILKDVRSWFGIILVPKVGSGFP